VQVGSAGKPEDRSFFVDAEEAGFFRRSERGFSNLIGKVNLDTVMLEKKSVERLGRVEDLQEVGAQTNRDIRPLDTERDGIREAHAAEQKDFLAGRDVQCFSNLGIRLQAAESENLRSRAGPASAHLLAEGENLPEILFELEARDESAFAALAIGNPQAAQGLESLASSHTADSHPNGDFLFGGDRLPGL
jgi:hypothetical protein